AHALAAEPHSGLRELIPTYRSLLVRYDALTTDYIDVAAWVERRTAHTNTAPPNQTRVVEVPTVYGGEHGPDLEWVAGHCGLSSEEVAQLHSRAEYTVYMMGFTPGYPYMGKLPPALEVPRLETPRARVRAGSVGIAGLQTGIYPLDSPGGWRIIGHTPLVLFDPNRASPFLFRPGDTVRFVPTT
ncbi:MAG TPA: 5-oxoprolinase subunit PxpB, partial [Anaerolineales bacterium]|nr:5-oxoprolinase subunit PxpB [Anaerolineales bacterium]